MELSWKSHIWLRFGKRATSFALKQQFEGLHFTISHVEGDDYVNFHLSNDKGPENNKAKLVIAKIKKNELAELLNAYNQAFWNIQMVPFDVKKYRYKKPKWEFRAQYFSLRRFENSPDYPEFKQMLTEIFNEHSQKKNGKIKMHKEIDLAFTDAVRLPYVKSVLRNNIRKFTGRTTSQTDYGLFISKQYTGLVIFVYDSWYRLKPEFNFIELLSSFLPELLVKKLHIKFNNALELMREATSYAETKKYNDPIDLSGKSVAFKTYLFKHERFQKE